LNEILVIGQKGENLVDFFFSFFTLKLELKADIGVVKSEIGTVKSDLEVKIAQTESKLIRWMFVFWVGQFASIVGTLTAILFAFFKP
jgi:hypothetical protein